MKKSIILTCVFVVISAVCFFGGILVLGRSGFFEPSPSPTPSIVPSPTATTEDILEQYDECQHETFAMQQCAKFATNESQLHLACTGGLGVNGMVGSENQVDPLCYKYMAEIVKLNNQFNCAEVWPYGADCPQITP